VFHDVNLHLRQRGPWLKGEQVHRQVELRVRRQQHLETGVFIAHERFAGRIGGNADDRLRRLQIAGPLVRLFEQHDAARRGGH
jgi:hypothetical protein